MEQPIAPRKANYNIYHVYKNGKVILTGIPETLINKEEIAVQLNLSFSDKQSPAACLNIIREAGYIFQAEFKEEEYKKVLTEYRNKLAEYNRYIMEYSIKDSGYNVTPLTEYLYEVTKQRDDSEFIDTYIEILEQAEKITGIKFLKGFI